MPRVIRVLLLACAAVLGPASATEGDVVFRSDVSLVRVDARVVDRDNRAITGLRQEDFILREEGRPQPIRNFSSENLPVDVLFLFDVSSSMRPHVERIASAAHQALRVLGDQDRVAIMVFDRSTRVRLPFRDSRAGVEREFDNMLRQETFNGGTDITRGLLDAAAYIGRQGRPGARRAIVIVTDDQTERNRDEDAVSRALTRADAVLMALIAPDAMGNRSGYPGGRGRMPRGGGSWPNDPGVGGPLGGPLGGIILGRRGPYGGRGPMGGPRSGGPVVLGSHTQSAGTSEIARRSGGDSLPVDDASALETTLDRIRQRYALHFYLPAGVRPGQERNIEVELADASRRRYPGAEVQYRRVYLTPSGPGGQSTPAEEPVVVSQAPVPDGNATPAHNPGWRRRPAVDQPDGPRGPSVGAGDAAANDKPAAAAQPQPASTGGWRRADESASQAAPAATPAPSAAPATDTPPRQGGWRRVKPGEQP